MVLPWLEGPQLLVAATRQTVFSPARVFFLR
jgi:hypothetical protein